MITKAATSCLESGSGPYFTIVLAIFELLLQLRDPRAHFVMWLLRAFSEEKALVRSVSAASATIDLNSKMVQPLHLIIVQ